jgi:hypothetical protein
MPKQLKKIPRRLEVVRSMPVMQHQIDSQEFDWLQSPLMAWVTAQPEVRAYLFDKIRGSGLIEFDAVTRTWKGVAE